MNDTPQKSPFARLDTSLMRSTKPQPETATSVKNKETSKRGEYPKVTYQLNPTITNVLQDTKIALQRQYSLKVTLADIVEEAIQHVCTDLQENKETSFLVSLFTRKQESK